MSVTGPQTRDWHSCGVANSSATGFLPTTSAKDCSCSSGAVGIRVSIDSSSPLAEATVSVCTRGAASPTCGDRRRRAGLTTLTCEGAASIPPPDWVTVSTDHGPGLVNLHVGAVDRGEQVALARRLAGAERRGR